MLRKGTKCETKEFSAFKTMKIHVHGNHVQEVLAQDVVVTD